MEINIAHICGTYSRKYSVHILTDSVCFHPERDTLLGNKIPKNLIIFNWNLSKFNLFGFPTWLCSGSFISALLTSTCGFRLNICVWLLVRQNQACISQQGSSHGSDNDVALWPLIEMEWMLVLDRIWRRMFAEYIFDAYVLGLLIPYALITCPTVKYAVTLLTFVVTKYARARVCVRSVWSDRHEKNSFLVWKVCWSYCWTLENPAVILYTTRCNIYKTVGLMYGLDVTMRRVCVAIVAVKKQ